MDIIEFQKNITREFTYEYLSEFVGKFIASNNTHFGSNKNISLIFNKSELEKPLSQDELMNFINKNKLSMKEDNSRFVLNKNGVANVNESEYPHQFILNITHSDFILFLDLLYSLIKQMDNDIVISTTSFNLLPLTKFGFTNSIIIMCKTEDLEAVDNILNSFEDKYKIRLKYAPLIYADYRGLCGYDYYDENLKMNRSNMISITIAEAMLSSVLEYGKNNPDFKINSLSIAELFNTSKNEMSTLRSVLKEIPHSEIYPLIYETVKRNFLNHGINVNSLFASETSKLKEIIEPSQKSTVSLKTPFKIVREQDAFIIPEFLSNNHSTNKINPLIPERIKALSEDTNPDSDLIESDIHLDYESNDEAIALSMAEAMDEANYQDELNSSEITSLSGNNNAYSYETALKYKAYVSDLSLLSKKVKNSDLTILEYFEKYNLINAIGIDNKIVLHNNDISLNPQFYKVQISSAKFVTDYIINHLINIGEEELDKIIDYYAASNERPYQAPKKKSLLNIFNK